MKNLIIKFLVLLFAVNLSYAQKWMTNLDIAQSLALAQNKMVLMVWEETTKYRYPVLVRDDKGRTLVIDDLFTDEYLSPLIWKNFVPVIVSENQYSDLYKEIKGKRKQSYIDKFNDDSIKIMDVNGVILNTEDFSVNYTDITNLITSYAFNTKFLTQELRGYKNKKDFYSAYYLASKYLDFALYVDKKIKPEIINVSDIYLKEAISLIVGNTQDESPILNQRVELLKIQKYLILKRPKKALRLLDKMDAETIDNSNKSFVAFLYFTVHNILREPEKAVVWKAELSSLNLQKAQMIINLND